MKNEILPKTRAINKWDNQTTLIDNEVGLLIRYHGTSRYTGCQCYKDDCGCRERFVNKPYSYYQVKMMFGSRKTTRHETLEDAEKRFQFLTNLYKERNETRK